MARFKIGDKVEIRPRREYVTVEKCFAGKIGVIDKIDYQSRYKWIRVDLGGFLQLWFVSSEVKHVTD